MRVQGNTVIRVTFVRKIFMLNIRVTIFSSILSMRYKLVLVNYFCVKNFHRLLQNKNYLTIKFSQITVWNMFTWMYST